MALTVSKNIFSSFLLINFHLYTFVLNFKSKTFENKVKSSSTFQTSSLVSENYVFEKSVRRYLENYSNDIDESLKISSRYTKLINK